MTTIAEIAAGHAERDGSRPTMLQSAAVCGFAFSHALDFRSLTPGGEPVQLLFLAAAAGSFLVGAVSLLDRPIRLPRRASWPLALGVLLVVGSTVSAAINQVPFGNFARLEQRYLLLLGAMVLTALWLGRGYPLRTLVLVLFWSSAVSMAWTFVYSALIVGFDVLRYRTTSASFGFVAAGLLAMLVTGRWRFWQLLLLGLTLWLVWLSQTRVYLLTILTMLACLGLHTLSNRKAGTGGRLKWLILLGFLALIVTAAMGSLGPWLERLLPAGGDPSAVARLAEFAAQWRLLTETPLNLLFGRGLGAEYEWMSRLPTALLGNLREALGAARFEFGHSLWVYSLFSSGLLLGWVLPVLFVGGGWLAFRLLRQRVSDPSALTMALYMLGALPATLASHPLGTRHAAVLLGASLAALPFLVCREARDG